MRSILGLGVAALLSACSAALITPAPRQMISARFVADVPQAGNAMDFDWWAQFNDAQLTALLQLARQNSPDLRSAAASVMKARAAAGESMADLSPAVTGEVARTVAKEDGSRRQATTTTDIDASWEVDLFGRLRQTAAASRLSAEAETVAFSGAYTSLSAEVADYYVQYRACRMIEAIYRQALTSQQETRSATGELAATGLSPDSDKALADANAASAAISLETQKADCRILAQTLAVTVGVAQGQIDAILVRGGGLPRPKAFRVGAVPAEVLRQRPDVIGAELDFASAMATMGAAKSDLFPSLSLGGTITLSNPQSWQFGPALSLPIFDGGQRVATLRGANADALSAGETWRGTVLSAVAEVEGAMTRLSAARRNGGNARTAVTSYQAYFQAIDNNWKAGGETLLNREEARRSLQSAEITEVEQHEDEVRQWIALFKAAGGGWARPAGKE